MSGTRTEHGWLADATKRADAATPGPWEADEFPLGEGDDQRGVWTVDHGVGITYDTIHFPDAEFIAHARTDLPRALALCRQLAEALAGFMPVAGRWLAIAPDDQQPMDLVLSENRSWNRAAAALSEFRSAVGEEP